MLGTNIAVAVFLLIIENIAEYGRAKGVQKSGQCSLVFMLVWFQEPRSRYPLGKACQQNGGLFLGVPKKEQNECCAIVGTLWLR